MGLTIRLFVLSIKVITIVLETDRTSSLTGRTEEKKSSSAKINATLGAVKHSRIPATGHIGRGAETAAFE